MTADNKLGSAQGMEDSNIRRSDHSFRSANVMTEFGTPNLEVVKRDAGLRVIPSGTQGNREALASIIQRPGVIGHAEAFNRPYFVNLSSAQHDRKLSIGSHDGVFLQPSGGQITTVNDPIRRGPLSDGGSVASSRRIERSSWYSNKNNDYDWTQLDNHDIKKFKVYSKGFYVVKTHVDTEIENEFRADVWRERQLRQNSQVQVISSKAFESIPEKLTLPKPTGTIEMDIREIQKNYNSASKPIQSQNLEPKVSSQAGIIFNHQQQPGISSVKPLNDNRRNIPPSTQGRILNSEDFRQLLHTNEKETVIMGPYGYKKIEFSDQPVGKTEYGDEVFGFDSQGYPVIQIEQPSKRPIFGFTAQNKKPVFGFSQYGIPQTYFDSLGRPVVGFDSKGYPVYDLKNNRIPITSLDKHLNAVLGYTKDKRPIYDVTSAGYLATSFDPTTGQLVYGYDWKWRPVFESDAKMIEEYAKSLPVVASDQFRTKIYGFDENRNPIYSFTKDRRPIFGFTYHHFPIFGINKDGFPILTFDSDMRPVYGFRENYSAVYDSRELTSGQKVCFPPGIEVNVVNLPKVFDVWGREVDKNQIKPIAPSKAPSTELGGNRKTSGTSADFAFFDQEGHQIAFSSLILDESGCPLPEFNILTNPKGQVISPGTPVYDKTGQKISKSGISSSIKPVLDYTGKQIGITYDGVTVLDQNNTPIATLTSTGKLRTLVPPSDLVGYRQVENTLISQEGKIIGQITQGNIIVDARGIPFAKVNRFGQIELDEDLSKQVEKVENAKSLAKDFVPKLTLPNTLGKDALFSESDRKVPSQQTKDQPQLSKSGGEFTGFTTDLRPTVNGQARFEMKKDGVLFDSLANKSLGKVESCPKNLNVPFGAHVESVLVDDQGQITGYILRDGHILNINGIPVGQLEPKVDGKELQYFLSEQGDSVTIYDPVKGILMDAHGNLIAKVSEIKKDGSVTLVDQSGKEIGVIDSQGRPTSKLLGAPINSEVYERVLRGEKLKEAEISAILKAEQEQKPIRTSETPEEVRKTVGGFYVDSLGRLLDQSNQPVGRILEGQLIGMDGQVIAVVQPDGTLKDLAGNTITETGSIVSRDGTTIGTFKLSSSAVIFPLAPSVPVIADVEGHKVIGCTATGDLVIGIDEQGQPIMGKVGFNKDGVRIVAIDIEGKPLAQSFVEDVVKMSTSAAGKNKKQVQQVVIEADEEQEDTDRAEERRKSMFTDPRASSKYAASQDKRESDGEEEEEGEEEEDDELLDQLGDEPIGAKDGGKLVKTDSFIFVPKAADAETQAAEEARQLQFLAEMDDMSNVKDHLEQQIIEQESKANSPEHKPGTIF